ncbi:MAG: FmdB family zinc ribbon protein [Polaromonas sp.]
MPIYAYKCESCGFAKDVLQKMSDTPLTDCPQCGAASFRKQLTAAGFQLKGSGWYVTDFRGGDGAAAAKTPDSAAGGSGTDSKPAESGTPAPGSASPAASVPAAASPAPAVAKASGGDSATKSS